MLFVSTHSRFCSVSSAEEIRTNTDNWQRCPACICVDEYFGPMCAVFVERSASSPRSEKVAGLIRLCLRVRVRRFHLRLQGFVTRVLRLPSILQWCAWVQMFRLQRHLKSGGWRRSCAWKWTRICRTLLCCVTIVKVQFRCYRLSYHSIEIHQ